MKNTAEEQNHHYRMECDSCSALLFMVSREFELNEQIEIKCRQCGQYNKI